jgi:hypothetical protein
MNEGEDAPPRILPRRSRLALGPILHILHGLYQAVRGFNK